MWPREPNVAARTQCGRENPMWPPDRLFRPSTFRAGVPPKKDCGRSPGVLTASEPHPRLGAGPRQAPEIFDFSVRGAGGGNRPPHYNYTWRNRCGRFRYPWLP